MTSGPVQKVHFPCACQDCGGSVLAAVFWISCSCLPQLKSSWNEKQPKDERPKTLKMCPLMTHNQNTEAQTWAKCSYISFSRYWQEVFDAEWILCHHSEMTSACGNVMMSRVQKLKWFFKMYLAGESSVRHASTQLFIPNKVLSQWLMTSQVSLCAACALCCNSR